jgi:hypothetical protein
MDMKEHILMALKEQFDHWEELLKNLDEEQVAAPRFDCNWSIKDVISHLWGWQQISSARIEAASLGREPVFPKWVMEVGGDWEENSDRTNAWFYETCHKKSWSDVHQDWRGGFLRLLDVAGPILEKDLLDGDRFPWLKGYSLAFILVATYDHHQEHLEKIIAALQ